MTRSVTVAIPTLNAGEGFAAVLDAVRGQRLDAKVELLIIDSGSADGTVATALDHGARVLRIPASEFSHGGTRNRLMAEAQGDHVALLTQDARPAHDGWLSALLGGFAAAPRVGLSFGPYIAPPGASPSVSRELEAWFASFGGPRVDRLEPGQDTADPRHFLGHRGFFTDANGCVARAAWERVPFRPIAYAEDHRLAQDMLRAGFAKAYVPEAVVVHGHDYSAWGWLQRSFDEARAVREVYGFAEAPRALARNLRGGVVGDLRWARAQPATERGTLAAFGVLTASVLHHGARGAGTFLGARSAALPAGIARRLSLERRG